jgi:nucleoid-associated protein YgaU
MKVYDEAKSSVLRAEEADAERYANLEFQAARDALEKSSSAIVSKNDKEALRFAMEANKSADLASRLAIERSEAEGSMAEEREDKILKIIDEKTEKKRKQEDSDMKIESKRDASKKKTILHKVSKGENLHLLSAYYYRNARLWKKIYEANKDVIENPHILKVGTTLKINVRGNWTPEFSLERWREAELQIK